MIYPGITTGFISGFHDAAMELGGRPLRLFFDITVPTIAPAMAALVMRKKDRSSGAENA